MLPQQLFELLLLRWLKFSSPEAFRSHIGGAGAVCEPLWCRQEDCPPAAETFWNFNGLSHRQAACRILSNPCSCCTGGCLHILPPIHKVSSCLLILSWSDMSSLTYNFSIFWNKTEPDFCHAIFFLFIFFYFFFLHSENIRLSTRNTQDWFVTKISVTFPCMIQVMLPTEEWKALLGCSRKRELLFCFTVKDWIIHFSRNIVNIVNKLKWGVSL